MNSTKRRASKALSVVINLDLDQNLIKNLRKLTRRKFRFGEKLKAITPVTHFFEYAAIKDHRSDRPATTVEWKCKLERCILRSKFGEFTNLNSHMNKHDFSRK